MSKLTEKELDAIERALGHVLPTLYRKLLTEIGFGHVGRAAEVHHPSTVWELYESFFDDPGQLFVEYFPFGCQTRKQEIWVINARAERAASIWHETVPDDWPEETWLPYDQWIERHLAPELRGDD